MTSYMTTFYFCATDGVELIKHIFEILPKTQIFRAPSNCSIIT